MGPREQVEGSVEILIGQSLVYTLLVLAVTFIICKDASLSKPLLCAIVLCCLNVAFYLDVL